MFCFHTLSFRLPSLRNVVVLNNPEEPAPQNFVRFNDLMKSKTDVGDMTNFDVQIDDPINIQFTSGTTGNPKGSTLSQHGIVNNAFFSAKRAYEGMPEAPIISCQVPLYHCFGCVVG